MKDIKLGMRNMHSTSPAVEDGIPPKPVQRSPGNTQQDSTEGHRG
jgi:hypothetical protein